MSKSISQKSNISTELQVPWGEAAATREAYGTTLIELADAGQPVMAVDADLASSTTTAKLGEKYPDRHFNVGIAEANMIGVAAGLSLAGNVVFTGSFAVFGTGRVYEQIRNTVCYSKLNVKIAPTHSGLSVGADGATHQMLEDINLMRGLPNMRVLVPASAVAARECIELAAQTPGPFYIRLGRAPVPEIYADKAQFSLGGSKVLTMGTCVTIIACGIEVAFALNAAEKLKEQGIGAEVIDAYSIKPLDVDTILKSVGKTGRVVTAEEHSVIGGLGSAVAELLVQHPDLLKAPLQFVGVQDEFGQSGTPEELFVHYKVDSSAIVEAALRTFAL